MTAAHCAIELPDEDATAALAAALAARAVRTDVIGLSGALGSGKTCFARAFILARLGPREVPSPTFTLVEAYESDRGPTIWHFDLYRLEKPEEAYELGIEEAFADGIALIEWPERLGSLLPREHLGIVLEADPCATTRRALLHPSPAWRTRVAELRHG